MFLQLEYRSISNFVNFVTAKKEKMILEIMNESNVCFANVMKIERNASSEQEMK